MPDRKQEELPQVTNAEWEIMKVLWESGPMAARDVYAALPEDHGWAYKTAKTLLARLVAKGAVVYDQVGNSYLYRAACTRDEVTRQEVAGFVERILGGSLSPVVAHFAQDRKLTDSDVNELRQLLDSYDRKKNKGRKK